MNITKPSVNKAVKALTEMGLLEYRAYGDINLTDDGKEVAKEIIKREDIIEMFLVEFLEIDKNVAKEEANSMKHVISKETTSKLEKYISAILNLQDLKCDYDVNSEKCRNCIRMTAKNRVNDNTSVTNGNNFNNNHKELGNGAAVNKLSNSKVRKKVVIDISKLRKKK